MSSPHLDGGGSAEVDDRADGADGRCRGRLDERRHDQRVSVRPDAGDDSDAATAPTPLPGRPDGRSQSSRTARARRGTRSADLTETITVVNHGPGEATGVDLTDALDAAAQVTSIEPGAFTCSSGTPLQCHLADLAAGGEPSFALVVRPLRPGRLIDAVTVSDDQLDPNYANDFAGRQPP